MIIQAKFKGKEGSMGYKNGRLYRLDFNIVSIFGTIKERVQIQNIRFNSWDKDTTVQYSSLKKFLENWDII